MGTYDHCQVIIFSYFLVFYIFLTIPQGAGCFGTAPFSINSVIILKTSSSFFLSFLCNSRNLLTPPLRGAGLTASSTDAYDSSAVIQQAHSAGVIHIPPISSPAPLARHTRCTSAVCSPQWPGSNRVRPDDCQNGGFGHYGFPVYQLRHWRYASIELCCGRVAARAASPTAVFLINSRRFIDSLPLRSPPVFVTVKRFP